VTARLSGFDGSGGPVTGILMSYITIKAPVKTLEETAPIVPVKPKTVITAYISAKEPVVQSVPKVQATSKIVANVNVSNGASASVVPIVTGSSSDISLKSYDFNGLDFKYPEKISLEDGSKQIVLSHSLPYIHRSVCTEGRVEILDDFADFSLTMTSYDNGKQMLRERMQYSDTLIGSDGSLKPDGKWKKVKLGSLDAWFMDNRDHGCGYELYAVPLPNGKIIMMNHSEVAEYDEANVGKGDSNIYFLDGTLSKQETNNIFGGIVASISTSVLPIENKNTGFNMIVLGDDVKKTKITDLSVPEGMMDSGDNAEISWDADKATKGYLLSMKCPAGVKAESNGVDLCVQEIRTGFLSDSLTITNVSDGPQNITAVLKAIGNDDSDRAEKNIRVGTSRLVENVVVSPGTIASGGTAGLDWQGIPSADYSIRADCSDGVSVIVSGKDICSSSVSVQFIHQNIRIMNDSSSERSATIYMKGTVGDQTMENNTEITILPKESSMGTIGEAFSSASSVIGTFLSNISVWLLGKTASIFGFIR
jgi:hypothetical protein